MLRGTEISCEWTFAQPRAIAATNSNQNQTPPTTTSTLATHRPVHLLGYFTHTPPVEGTEDPLKQLFSTLGPRRRQRNLDVLKRLEEVFHIRVTQEEVLAAARDQANTPSTNTDANKVSSASSASSTSSSVVGGDVYFGRPHIARALIRGGYATSMTDAFSRFLNDDVLPMSPWSFDFVESIHAIHQHGGVAVLAHPMTIGITLQDIEEELRHLLHVTRAPLKGIEAYSTKASLDESRSMVAIARRLDLITTGGSDYHGSNKDHVELGTFGKAAADSHELTESNRLWREVGQSSFERLKRERRKRRMELHESRLDKEDDEDDEAIGIHALSIASYDGLSSLVTISCILLFVLLTVALVRHPRPTASAPSRFVDSLRMKANRIVKYLFEAAASSAAILAISSSPTPFANQNHLPTRHNWNERS